MDTKLTTPVPEELKTDNLSDGGELVPSEVAARKNREGEINTNPELSAKSDSKVADGYTVSGQGLINNHAITPDVYVSDKPLDEKRRDLTMLGIVALSIVGLILGVTIIASMSV
ncbi:MAG: hypothetical protein HC799_06135 [Limnothrix sp. RL_2_0]|nr:hypothetical protein [Limnothrix sp. RL_2_0]